MNLDTSFNGEVLDICMFYIELRLSELPVIIA
jgi:hypothetical protein